jgi:hypothetical protein
VASRSIHLQPSSVTNGLININQVAPQYYALGSALLDKAANPFYGSGGTGLIGGATVARAQLLKPYPEFGNVQAGTDFNHALYDSIVVKAQKRMSQGVTFLATYTWARNMDASFAGTNFLNPVATSYTYAQNYYNLAGEYSLANVSTPDRFVGTVTYELPFGTGKRWLRGKGVTDYLVGGWQMNAITIYQTGFPLAIVQSTNLNAAIGAQMQRPNATGVSPVTSGPLGSRLDSYINPAAFSNAPQFTFGNLSRTIPYRGPGQANWDLSIFKDIKVKERVNAQVRAEALNAFNTPQFRAPSTVFGSSAFGSITQQANFPRYLQLGFRLFF